MTKQTKQWILGLVIFFILVLATYGVGFKFGKMMYSSTKPLNKDSWLVINSSGYLPEYQQIEFGSFWGTNPQSVEELCRKIRHAATDNRIKGILLEPYGLQTGYASLGELVLALQDFRKSGKPVIAHGDMMTQQDYYLALGAESIAMEPSASAGLMLQGVGANIMFYKEMLDKIGVKMQVMQSGEFKGAGEPYSRTSLSSGALENISKALKGRYDLLLEALASSRGIDLEQARFVFEERPDFFIKASQALEYGLIDQVAGRDSILAQHGITASNSIKVSQYKVHAPQPSGSSQIAILNLEGAIAPVNPSSFSMESGISASGVQSMLDDIEKNSRIKAVVLRINSPGGSALESEIIYQKLQRLSQKMPVVVSVGGMAASGGYYISCASDYIVSDQFGITGSIGVIMMLPEAAELGKKLGLRSQSFGYGKFSSVMDPLNPYDQEFLDSLRRNSTGIYDEFKARVMQARGYSPEEIGQVAEGRIFSAADALENGLIDSIGNLDAAVVKAAELAKLDSYTTTRLPHKKNFYELIWEYRSSYSSIATMLTRQKLSPEELAEELVSRLQTWEWLYYLPYKLD